MKAKEVQRKLLAAPYPDVIQVYEDLLKSARTGAEVKQYKRWLCLNDLFYLLVFAMDVKFIVNGNHNTVWLYERIREVQQQPNGHLDLWAREHFKSTVITLGKTVQDILRDPELTVGIFSHTKENATIFTSQIRDQLGKNEELKYLFDDILWQRPETQAPEWTDSSFTVKRNGKPKEPTVMACGLLPSMPTGMHFGLRVYDDIITDKVVGTPEMIQKITAAYRNSINLGRDGGSERVIGTRYHLFDTYRQMMKDGVLKVREYPATEDGSLDLTKAVFQSEEYLRNKLKAQGTFIFSCQMLQNPLADAEMGFQEKHLRFWEATNYDNLNFVILCDPAGGKDKNAGKKKSDYTCFWVVGIGGDDNYYVCDVLRARIGLVQRGDALFTLHRRYSRYGEVRVGYESYGMQADIAYFNERMERENYRFRIIELGGQMKKELRIARLAPLFEAGRIWLPYKMVKNVTENGVTKAVDMIRVFIEEEYTSFPVLQHDDMLDALSRLLDDEIRRMPRPDPVEDGYSALNEIRKRQMANEPVV